jgi:ATP-dependent DNA helicase RecG
MKTEAEMKELIAGGESLTLEFKSDRASLPDNELIAALVGLANTEGGFLLFGVEDDGTVTALHKNHRNLSSLPAMVANKTSPPLAISADVVEVDGSPVGLIAVPKARHIVASTQGLVQRRRLKVDGTPESIPFLPHEFTQRQSSLGLVDPSAAPVMGMEIEQLSPLERERIREAIRLYGGDQSLLQLEDRELDGALGFITEHEGTLCPTVAGLLLLGKEGDLRRHLPAHEVAFQVLHGTDVRVNEFYRRPLLQTFKEVENLFLARVEEQEVEVGLFRVPVPNYDRRAFREAFVNSLVHRDYSRLGAVHVRLDDDGMTISSPGGFVEGVTLNNLLTTAPRSRNPLLADIVKRIGLAERTGRGIDRIFEGMLRYGRSLPDYSMSNEVTVSVQLSNADADMDFLEMILAHEEKAGALPIDSLIILSCLREGRRMSCNELAGAVQKPENSVRSTLERLMESGVVDAHGSGRGRTYTLSAKVYRHAGQKAAYVRQSGFDRIQQEQMVLNFIDAHKSIKRADVMELCQITKDQAAKLLKRMAGDTIEMKGKLSGAHYLRKP